MSSSSTSDNAAYLDEDISYRLMAATTIILVATTILFGLRLYTRTLPSIKPGPEDLLLIAAYILSTASCLTGYLAITYGGAGRHVEYVVMKNPGTIMIRGKLLYSLVWVSGYSNFFSRTSMLTIFYRVFTPGVARTCTVLLIVYLILYTLSQTIIGAVQCRPLAYYWNQSTVKGTCIDQFLYYKLIGLFNIAADVGIFLLPLYTVWNLHASLARRAGIALVFMSGSIGIIASCVRTASFFTSAKQSMEDPTWTDVQLMSWTIVESGMYTAAASIMRLRPLLGKLPTWFKSFRNSERAESWKVLRGRDQDGSKSPPRASKVPDNQGNISLHSFEVRDKTTV
ncbi:integral membrane protein [Penicillium lividum]|nr:integral membrane protein [Penicillium lividum]